MADQTRRDIAQPPARAHVPRLTRRGLMSAALSAAPLMLAGLSLATAAEAPAKRIVVAGGALTEIAYALGQADRIVGVDTTSTFPAQAQKDKASIGYVRQLSPEGILSLQPDVLLLQEGGGPPEALTLVSQAGVRIVRAPEAATEQGVLERIATVGAVTGAQDAAGKLEQQVRDKFAALAEKRKKITKPARVMFILSLQNGRPLVAGAGASADGMIRLAGGENVASGFQGYKPMTDEAVIEAAPDVILMMSGGPRQHAAGDVFKTPALSATPAAKTQRLLSLDGLYLLGFGPRAPDAALEVFNALYPELKEAR
ncbi:iron complex transport system substrate-binding protein [Camelimonas lactis]|uniref:Iron complex transport system substrate-binding protein n=2 Tax=Camelimonas lactis TaxID=659006 RepID=A0A4R2GSE4_9HYPH|nr:iron complex transport system substrate-binding protein [Camelimonas lactis]